MKKIDRFMRSIIHFNFITMEQPMDLLLKSQLDRKLYHELNIIIHVELSSEIYNKLRQ